MLVVGLAARVETLEAENAELRRRLGMNSTNSSRPPSKDSIGAKAARRADRSSRERSKDRKPGGQPGRKGSRLAPTVTPDRTETLPPPGECSGRGAGLAGAADAGMSWAQGWDILPIVLAKVHYLFPRRRCGCGRTTTAAPSLRVAGTVVYGPNINAAAILLAKRGQCAPGADRDADGGAAGCGSRPGSWPVPWSASLRAWPRAGSMTP